MKFIAALSSLSFLLSMHAHSDLSYMTRDQPAGSMCYVKCNESEESLAATQFYGNNTHFYCKGDTFYSVECLCIGRYTGNLTTTKGGMKNGGFTSFTINGTCRKTSN